MRFGGDALCPYDALVRHWAREVGGPPPRQGRISPLSPRAMQPIFRTAKGDAMDTADVRDIAQRMAAACGEPPEEFGGKSFRVGGATDLRDVLGTGGMEMIKQRGRWNSDIASIYQRTLAMEQFDGASRMADADSPELEALICGWSQPATR